MAHNVATYERTLKTILHELFCVSFICLFYRLLERVYIGVLSFRCLSGGLRVRFGIAHMPTNSRLQLLPKRSSNANKTITG